ncbi:TPA: tail fiber assembly protein [Citrobacter freundii]|uniref:tail fiber assembly protein n=1 Tax=Citrobacter freundii TaxID=546 RepID=UPI0023AF398A|nr:tail fiber assembly protein [Citrobacter freundii]MDE8797402.1 tail fiber assembly protein [Citrobacter freundii]HEE9835053.1 tail fiber assembly protein [Citrobacter freundii]HEE9896645.1 tail fiber assembly protein [Citrobacter freundii]HEE9952490.1 tail fiber assembly protein [Citrobacter freundii]HEF0050895.1 tail fiber assembly protein [Citrobacter freundii]
MQSFGKFIPYIPDVTNRPKVIDGQNVLFLQDDKGNDWYDVIELFDESKTLKIGYDDDGRVRTFTTNIHALFPVNLSVVELPATKANLRVTLGDDWFYKDGKLQQIRNHLADAEGERDRRMAKATARIDWLEAAQNDGDISADEETELAALRAYRTALRRLDLTTAPDVKWPEYSVA